MWESEMKIITKGVGLVIGISLPLLMAGAQEIPVEKVISTIKNFNFVTTSIGILSEGVSDATIKQLTALQTAPPRALRIYLTQSNTIWKIFDDFTFLVNEKGAEAIVIWPSKALSDPNEIRKITIMSKKKRIPIIALQKGWIEEGATAYISFEDGIKVYVNEQVRSVLNFPIAERSEYELIRQ
jgi:ABC-type uncharacterized transport system substrate-binding protein